MATGISGPGSNAAGIFASIIVPPSPFPPEPEDDPIEEDTASTIVPPINLRPVLSGSPFAPGIFSPRLEAVIKAETNKKLASKDARRWCRCHGRQVPPPPVPAHIMSLIQEWFDLVDADRSERLDRKELAIALKAAGIPCTDSSLNEFYNLMDYDRDGKIGFKEFYNFIAWEVVAGNDVITSEIKLPSGLGLPLGSMIEMLRRKRVMAEIERGGSDRSRGVLRAEQYINNMSGMSKVRMKRLPSRRSSSRHSQSPATSEASNLSGSKDRLHRKGKGGAVTDHSPDVNETLVRSREVSIDEAPAPLSEAPFDTTKSALPSQLSGPSVESSRGSSRLGGQRTSWAKDAAASAEAMTSHGAGPGSRVGHNPSIIDPLDSPLAAYPTRAMAGLQLLKQGGRPWPRLRLSDMGGDSGVDGSEQQQSPAATSGGRMDEAGSPSSSPGTPVTKQRLGNRESSLRASCPLPLRSLKVDKSPEASPSLGAGTWVVSEHDMLDVESMLHAAHRGLPAGLRGQGSSPSHMTFAGGSDVIFGIYPDGWQQPKTVKRSPVKAEATGGARGSDIGRSGTNGSSERWRRSSPSPPRGDTDRTGSSAFLKIRPQLSISASTSLLPAAAGRLPGAIPVSVSISRRLDRAASSSFRNPPTLASAAGPTSGKGPGFDNLLAQEHSAALSTEALMIDETRRLRDSLGSPKQAKSRPQLYSPLTSPSAARAVASSAVSRVVPPGAPDTAATGIPSAPSTVGSPAAAAASPTSPATSPQVRRTASGVSPRMAAAGKSPKAAPGRSWGVQWTAISPGVDPAAAPGVWPPSLTIEAFGVTTAGKGHPKDRNVPKTQTMHGDMLQAQKE